MVCALTVLKLYNDGVCINCVETCAVLGDVCRATAVQAGGHGLSRCHRQDPAGGTAPTVRPLPLTFAGSWRPLCNKTDDDATLDRDLVEDAHKERLTMPTDVSLHKALSERSYYQQCQHNTVNCQLAKRCP